MFPLGSVLLPGMVLPLHVFEDRYRALVRDVLDAPEPEFGVVLIERGSEVGGGDVRATVGCSARIVEAAATPDGRWAVVAVGTSRLRVESWLPDDPYPLAEVGEWGDEPDPPDRWADALTDAEVALRRTAALGSELGLPALPEDLELSEDPVLRSYQLGVLAPVGPLDRQRLLCCPGPALRVALLVELLAEQEELLRARLGGWAHDDPPDGPTG